MSESEQVHSFDVVILDQIPLESSAAEGVYITPYGWDGQPLCGAPLSLSELISSQCLQGGRPYWEGNVMASLPFYRPAGGAKRLDEDKDYVESRIRRDLGDPRAYKARRVPR